MYQIHIVFFDPLTPSDRNLTPRKYYSIDMIEESLHGQLALSTKHLEYNLHSFKSQWKSKVRNSIS